MMLHLKKKIRLISFLVAAVCLLVNAYGCSNSESSDPKTDELLQRLRDNVTKKDYDQNSEKSAAESVKADSDSSTKDLESGKSIASPTPGITASVIPTITATVIPNVSPTALPLPTPVKVEHPPRLAPLVNQGMEPDTVLEDISIVIDDPDGPLNCAQSLSAVSSDQSIVQSQKIIFSGSYPNCKMKLEPQSSKSSGRSAITVTLSDGQHTVSGDFVLTVGNGNQPPQISVLSSFRVQEESTATINFEVIDQDGPWRSCQNERFKYTSRNVNESNRTPIVASLDAVRVEGTWPNCTATISLQPNQWGQTKINLWYNDGISESQPSEFTLNVDNVNDVPMIESEIAANYALNEDSILTLPFKVNDKLDGDILPIGASCSNENYFKAVSTNTTLFPVGRITFSGNFPDCVVSFSPAVDQNGTADVSLYVFDNLYQAVKNSKVTVSADDDAPYFRVPTYSIVDDGTFSPDLLGFIDRTQPRSKTGRLALSIEDVDGPSYASDTCPGLSAMSSATTIVTVSLNGCQLNINSLAVTGESEITLRVIHNNRKREVKFKIKVP